MMVNAAIAANKPPVTGFMMSSSWLVSRSLASPDIAAAAGSCVLRAEDHDAVLASRGHRPQSSSASRFAAGIALGIGESPNAMRLSWHDREVNPRLQSSQFYAPCT